MSAEGRLKTPELDGPASVGAHIRQMTPSQRFKPAVSGLRPPQLFPFPLMTPVSLSFAALTAPTALCWCQAAALGQCMIGGQGTRRPSLCAIHFAFFCIFRV